MTGIIILESSPTTHQLISSSPSSIPLSDNDGSQQQRHESSSLFNILNLYPVSEYRERTLKEEEEEGWYREGKRREKKLGRADQPSLLGVWVTLLRKSLIACSSTGIEKNSSMDIGVPTNVRHVAHVTFDRFNGFLGLPVEFEPEVSRRPPSASASVFGVSTESMQLSFDFRGNSVPTILLMMQRRLYMQGGLQAEGIFRITGENGQEEFTREQLNMGLVPDNVDVHCLAGLIKAWFRELPNGVLDSLSPEQVIQAQSEQQCTELVRLLPPTEAALLDWAINLMADVAQLENINKMNSRNIAMVFAPNMTQMADPLTALMYAVQVMNFLKTLIEKTLRDREDSIVETGTAYHSDPSDDNEHKSSSQPMIDEVNENNREKEVSVAKESFSDIPEHPSQGNSKHKTETLGFLTSFENITPAARKGHLAETCPDEACTTTDEHEEGYNYGKTIGAQVNTCKARYGQSSNSSVKKGSKKRNDCPKARLKGEKSRGSTIISRSNSRAERLEAWR